jgi:predicted DNA-binding antitoxin AbrB/MazE fold protein
MARTVRAVYEAGHLRLLEPVDLTDGQAVHVTISHEAAELPELMTEPRIAGLHRGEIWTSDDFDAPLPDEFWLGEG